MRYAVSGALATAITVAMTGTAFAQNSTNYYQQIQGSYQAGTIAPAATSTYQAPTAAQPTMGSTLYPAASAFTTQPGTTYAPQASVTYAPPAASSFVPQQAVGPTFATSPTTQGALIGQPTSGFGATTPSYASPHTPTTTATAAPTYIAPAFGTATTTYQQPGLGGTITSQPLSAPVPATAFTPSIPTTTTQMTATSPAPTAAQLQDTDTWTYNLARFYPAVQACLRRSTAKNPVIANIQEQGNQTMMLIGEGGSSTYSTCSTGLTGTTVKANSDIRNLPPAFFAPLGSTFTVTPDRPFQPIVDTDQKVIGWLVRTQPSQAVNQFGQAAGFDGQFIPPMMVNTSVGKS